MPNKYLLTCFLIRPAQPSEGSLYLLLTDTTPGTVTHSLLCGANLHYIHTVSSGRGTRTNQSVISTVSENCPWAKKTRSDERARLEIRKHLLKFTAQPTQDFKSKLSHAVIKDH